jgi:hypothetical protein
LQREQRVNAVQRSDLNKAVRVGFGGPATADYDARQQVTRGVSDFDAQWQSARVLQLATTSPETRVHDDVMNR